MQTPLVFTPLFCFYVQAKHFEIEQFWVYVHLLKRKKMNLHTKFHKNGKRTEKKLAASYLCREMNQQDGESGFLSQPSHSAARQAATKTENS